MDLDRILGALSRSPIAVFELDDQLHFIWGRQLNSWTVPKGLAGKRSLDLLPPGFGEEAERLMRQVLASGTGTHAELAIPGRQGTNFVDLIIEPLVDGSDRRVGVTCAAIDVTERKLLAEQLAASDSLATSGMLVAGVAHDTSNLLTWLMSNLRRAILSLQGHSCDSSHNDLVHQLSEALHGAGQIENLVSDLRSCTRPNADEMKVVSLAQALGPACRLVTHQIRRRARFELEWGPAPPVLADPSRLGQLVINLLLNAAEAIPENRVADNQVWFSTSTSADGGAAITVFDTGCGIDPSIQDHIFDPFFTTRAAVGGSGLGLWICNNIVKAHGGRISCTSTPAKGTEFLVTLPAASVPAEAAK